MHTRLIRYAHVMYTRILLYTRCAIRILMWPIVESSLNGPGYSLLGLNAEHLMRRIAAESDTTDDGKKR